MRALVPVLLATVLLASCVQGTCDAPAGCLRAGQVQGSCQCLEWSTVKEESVPVKFVVLSVIYQAPGNRSELWYGHRVMAPSANSEIGGRWRSVIRSPVGPDQVASLGRVDAGTGGFLAQQVTAASVATGEGTGFSEGWQAPVDVPSVAQDQIRVWVNPVAALATDFAGNRWVEWSWSANCMWPPAMECNGAFGMDLAPGELDGSTPAVDYYKRAFLANLTDGERAAILRYHPLYDPPGRDPSTLAGDPRFGFLGTASVSPSAASWSSPTWIPCSGSLQDADFPVYAQTETRFGSGSESFLVQHSVQSITAICTTQEPGLQLGTSTPGCLIQADLYMDRAFGTVLAIPTLTSPECTRP
jgi:hypothetical protein